VAEAAEIVDAVLVGDEEEDVGLGHAATANISRGGKGKESGAVRERRRVPPRFAARVTAPISVVGVEGPGWSCRAFMSLSMNALP
jgi:hypothetical protein